jgi:inosine triphosphate pyrophosphatase
MLYFITGNNHKFAEIHGIIPTLTQLTLELDEIQSLDPKAVIEHKLNQAAGLHDGAFIVEDTIFSLPCLNGLPGTFIKFFEQKLGAAGLAELVLKYSDHSATVLTTIGYRTEAGDTHYFTGEYSGQIVEPRGANGFGFDPIFLTDGQTKTNAELTQAQKTAFSARGIAARKLRDYLKTQAV